MEVMTSGNRQSGQSVKFDEYQATKRFANLDGVRFISISLVLWHHLPPIDIVGHPIFSRGFLGVDFFFVLSGYLITTLLLREERRNGRISMTGFYIRRALRILPLFFFVVLSVGGYYILISGRWELLGLVPYYLLFMSNFMTEHIPLLTITWSLAVEEQFYLLWPLFLVITPKRFLLPASLILIAINIAGGMDWFGVAAPEFRSLRFELPAGTYAPLIIGGVAACLLDREKSYGLLAKTLGGRWTALIGLVALVGIVAVFPLWLTALHYLAIHTIMALIITSLVIREDNAALGFLQSPFVVRVGTVSYGIYLYHLILADIVGRAGALTGLDNAWFKFGVYYLLAWLAAEISFRTLEAYFQRFRPKS